MEVEPHYVPGQDNDRVMPRCLVVDDDSFTRVTVAAALEGRGFEIAAVAGSVEEAMEVNPRDYDCAVLDLDLGPGPSGIDLAFGLRRRHAQVGIVILTSFSDPRLFTSSVKEPPPGSTYVVKQSLSDIGLLVAAISGIGVAPMESASSIDRVPISDTQVETLRLLAYGLSNAEIADIRVVTERSIEQAIRRLAATLHVDEAPGSNQRVALAREYFRLTGATRHAHAHR